MQKDLNHQIERILNNSPDPLEVRKTTFEVIRNMKFIKINLRRINKLSGIIKSKVKKGKLLTSDQFGSDNPTPQLVFVLDAINFCFWAYEGKEKWTVEFPSGVFISNGWYALATSIERARKEGIPILEAKFMKNLKMADAKYIFRSANDTPIPLLKERVVILNEIGKTLDNKYQGNIYNFLSDAKLKADLIAKRVVEEFPSFQDSEGWDNITVNFYKRAQIFAYDIGLLEGIRVGNVQALTMFADYKIPQILRAFGVLDYQPDLASKVDNYQILEKGSIEEIELRAATVWACELISERIDLPPAHADNVLWKMSQGLKDVKPYHRVLTTSY